MNLKLILANTILVLVLIRYIQKTQSKISITKSFGYTEGAFVEGQDQIPKNIVYIILMELIIFKLIVCLFVNIQTISGQMY